MLLFIGVLSLLHCANGLILPNGTFTFCGVSPEMSARGATGSIDGAFNTLHQVERESCDERTEEEMKFRTHDGTCNARHDLGAAFSVVKRLMVHRYPDETSAPRDRSFRGRSMPNARSVSKSVHQPKPTQTHRSLMLMQFGQFLDHDTSLVNVASEMNSSIRCCGVPEGNKYTDCYEIDMEEMDEALNKSCIEFIRSDAVTYSNGTVPYPREHRNALTAWVDASNIYGSDRERATELRTRNGTGALLKTSYYKGQERLPEGHDGDCINTHSHHFCALAGDERVNEQPGLTAIHTMFHLEHNRLVRMLVRVVLYRQGRPYSDSAVSDFLDTAPDKIHHRLYHVIRKVLSAVWQNLVYGEFLPLVLGQRIMTDYGLWTGRRVTHDPDIDPSISEEFLGCAFRFGHTLVNDMMVTDHMRSLHELFSTSSHNLEHYNTIIRGLVGRRNNAEAFDAHIADSLVNKLFANGVHGALDLAALNVQRGRDHGLPRHNELRRHFGLRPYTSWSDYGDVWAGMKFVYDDLEDVECFPGGTAESPVDGGVIGVTFANIIAQQFHDLKYGDRYYFETSDTDKGFTFEELQAIRQYRFSKIICENARLPYIQEDPFQHPDYTRNPVYRCEDFTDLRIWFFSKYFL